MTFQDNPYSNTSFKSYFEKTISSSTTSSHQPQSDASSHRPKKDTYIPGVTDSRSGSEEGERDRVSRPSRYRRRSYSRSRSRSRSPPSRKRSDRLRYSPTSSRSHSRSRSRSPPRRSYRDSRKNEESRYQLSYSRNDDRDYNSREREGRSRQESYNRRDEGYDYDSRKDEKQTLSDSVETIKPVHDSPGEPTATIMVQGLSFETVEATVQAFFVERDADIEAIRIPREPTGKSRGYCFVKFRSLEASIFWMERHFPTIELDGFRCRIEYGKAMKVDDGDWVCGNCHANNFKKRDACFKCRLPKNSTYSMSTAPKNDGARDVGTVPSSLLLVRGIATNITEEMLYNAIAAYVPVHSVFIIRHRISRVSFGFGFVEFHDVNGADQLLTLVFNPQNPNPIYLEGQLLSLAYAHPQSFLPAYTKIQGQWATRGTYDANGQYVQVMYWDESTFASPYFKPVEVASQDPNATALSTETTTVEKQFVPGNQVTQLQTVQNISSQEGPINSSLNAAAATIKAPVTEAGQEPSSSVSAQDSAQETASTTPPAATSTTAGTGFKKLLSKKSATSGGNKLSIQLQKWQQKHTELKQVYEEEPNFLAGVGKNTVVTIPEAAILEKLPTETAVNEEYSDYAQRACLLCQRQFKSIEDLQKHQQKSKLHQTNMESLRAKQKEEIRTKLEAEYKEKMKKKKQGKKIGYSSVNTMPIGSGAAIPKALADAIEDAPPLPPQNIGAKMLQKMGWKEGFGLGARGDGIVNPVEGVSFAGKAGIGTSAGVTVTELTTSVNGKDPRSYQEMLKRHARQRLMEDRPAPAVSESDAMNI